MGYKHFKVIYPTVQPYLACHKILTHKLRHYKPRRKNRTEAMHEQTCLRSLAISQAPLNSCLMLAIPLSEHTVLTGFASQRLLNRASNRLSLFFYSIIYNAQFWQYVYLFEISFTDEVIAYNNYNLSVIINTTQCLLNQGCIL
jgi:hypothetical protein